MASSAIHKFVFASRQTADYTPITSPLLRLHLLRASSASSFGAKLPPGTTRPFVRQVPAAPSPQPEAAAGTVADQSPSARLAPDAPVPSPQRPRQLNGTASSPCASGLLGSRPSRRLAQAGLRQPYPHPLGLPACGGREDWVAPLAPWH